MGLDELQGTLRGLLRLYSEGESIPNGLIQDEIAAVFGNSLCCCETLEKVREHVDMALDEMDEAQDMLMGLHP